MVGSLISDVDKSNSKAGKSFKNILFLISLIGAVLIGLNYYFNFTISLAYYDKEILNGLYSLVLFLVLAFFASTTSHRSFSHSIVGVMLLTIPIYNVFGVESNYFLIGIVSHILLDILNKMPVKIFYMLDQLVYLLSTVLGKNVKKIAKCMEKGICFYICYSDGIISKAFLYISVAILLKPFLVIFENFIK